jgi:hypothetical protein
MRVDELREALRAYDPAVLREIAVELYKAVPKEKKTEQFDAALRAFAKGSKLTPRRAAPADFEEVRFEAVQLLENASQGFYFQPNRVIPKARRTKWRFEVRRVIKALLAARGEHSEDAAHLLLDVYAMLSYACGVYLFPTDSPFSAVGYEQPELLGLAIDKLLYLGVTEESIELAVCVTLDSVADRHTWSLPLLRGLAGALKTNPAREMARDAAKRFPAAYERYLKSKRLFRRRDDSAWAKGKRANQAVELYLLRSLALHEPEEGIAYYNRHYKTRWKEPKLFTLLSYHLSDEGLESYWLREYESAVAREVEPREELRADYERRLAAKPAP